MSYADLFVKIVRALPRSKLEEFIGNEARPWQMDRKALEQRVIASDSSDLREEIADYVSNAIIKSNVSHRLEGKENE